jgi:hypothetical protein
MKISVRVKFERRDLWIGLFWDRDFSLNVANEYGEYEVRKIVKLYFCLIPLLPIIVTITGRPEIREIGPMG